MRGAPEGATAPGRGPFVRGILERIFSRDERHEVDVTAARLTSTVTLERLDPVSGLVISLISLQLATLGVLAGALFWPGSRLGGRIDRLDQRISGLGERLAAIEVRLDGIDGRLDDVVSVLQGLDQRVRALEHPSGV